MADGKTSDANSGAKAAGRAAKRPSKNKNKKAHKHAAPQVEEASGSARYVAVKLRHAIGARKSDAHHYNADDEDADKNDPPDTSVGARWWRGVTLAADLVPGCRKCALDKKANQDHASSYTSDTATAASASASAPVRRWRCCAGCFWREFYQP